MLNHIPPLMLPECMSTAEGRLHLGLGPCLRSSLYLVPVPLQGSASQTHITVTSSQTCPSPLRFTCLFFPFSPRHTESPSSLDLLLPLRLCRVIFSVRPSVRAFIPVFPDAHCFRPASPPPPRLHLGPPSYE